MTIMKDDNSLYFFIVSYSNQQVISITRVSYCLKANQPRRLGKETTGLHSVFASYRVIDQEYHEYLIIVSLLPTSTISKKDKACIPISFQ